MGKPKYLLLFRLHVHFMETDVPHEGEVGVYSALWIGEKGFMHACTSSIKMEERKSNTKMWGKIRIQGQKRASEWVGVSDWHRSGSGCVYVTTDWECVRLHLNGKCVWSKNDILSSVCVYEVAFPEWIWMSLPHVKSYGTGWEGQPGVALTHTHTCRVYIL